MVLTKLKSYDDSLSLLFEDENDNNEMLSELNFCISLKKTLKEAIKKCCKNLYSSNLKEVLDMIGISDEHQLLTWYDEGRKVKDNNILNVENQKEDALSNLEKFDFSYKDDETEVYINSLQNVIFKIKKVDDVYDIQGLKFDQIIWDNIEKTYYEHMNQKKMNMTTCTTTIYRS